jgi:alpha-galactosidase
VYTQPFKKLYSGCSSRDIATSLSFVYSFLRQIAQFFATSGIQSAGYTFIDTDDGWDSGSRNATGYLQADPLKFPSGIANLTGDLHAQGFKFGIYAAASSVVCSGRPGSLYLEDRDARTFAEWGVDLVKYGE